MLSDPSLRLQKMSRTPHGVALDLLNSMLGDLIIDFADDDVNTPWCSTGFARSMSSHRSCRRKTAQRLF